MKGHANFTGRVAFPSYKGGGDEEGTTGKGVLDSGPLHAHSGGNSKKPATKKGE